MIVSSTTSDFLLLFLAGIFILYNYIILNNFNKKVV
jgi:cbb3-type cytochrome oxidase subunit 3